MAHLQNSNGQLDRKGYVTFLSSLEPKILLDKMHIAVPSGNLDMQPKMLPRFLLFFLAFVGMNEFIRMPLKKKEVIFYKANLQLHGGIMIQLI